MAQSLGLTLYNLSGGGRQASLPVWPEPPVARPGGRLIWMHAPGPGSVAALVELARRLIAEAGHAVVLTCPEQFGPQIAGPQTFGPLAAGLPRGALAVEPPPDTPAAARIFLDRFRPELGILSDGELRPALLAEAEARHLPLLIVDARAPYLPPDRKGWFNGWFPGLTRGLLSDVDLVLALDETAARAFGRAGVPATRLRTEGRMEEGSRALGCNEAERAALLRQFDTRPVWLAACLPEAEEAAVIAAHRMALRLAHRMLLVIVPELPERGDALARHIEETEGWTVARRSMDQEPDAETEVYLADAASELGLWYRLAPITFLGGSLAGTGSLRDPYEPAALGSAILHGPRHGVWATSFSRLSEARATRSVATAVDMGDAVGDLLSPDRTARMAQAAWAVSSSGAEVTDRVVALVGDLLAART